MIGRREFLKLCAVGSLLGLNACARSEAEVLKGSLISGVALSDGGYAVVVRDFKTRTMHSLMLPYRAHGSVVHPFLPHQAVVFARRPGNLMSWFDWQAEAITHMETVANRHFLGHGAFSADGKTLFTTENDYKQGRGVIGVWDASVPERIKRVDEWSSNGIGPHEMLRLPNGNLAIANGGIQTHPDFYRRKLNLATMQPNLTIMDAGNGAVLDQDELDNHLLSIRHLDVADDGDIVVGLQLQGRLDPHQPLAALKKPHQALALMQPDPSAWSAFNGYMASVRIDSLNQRVAISSPRGHRVGFWSLHDGSWQGEQVISEVSGLGFDRQAATFIATTARGELSLLSYNNQSLSYRPILQSADLQWDNHAIYLS